MTETVQPTPKQEPDKDGIDTKFWVTLVIGVLAIIVAIAIFFMQRTTKSLSYDAFYVRDNLTTGPRFAGKGLEVSFNGVRIDEPHIVFLYFTNTGNVPIRRDDFEAPLRVVFPNAKRIVSAQAGRASPEDLSVQIKQDPPRGIVVSPLLLNDKEWFSIQLLIDGPANSEVTGRIAGVHSIQKRNVVLQGRGAPYALPSWPVIVVASVAIVFIFLSLRHLISILRRGKRRPSRQRARPARRPTR